MKAKPFYGWWITVAAIFTFGIAVGVPYYSMPFFYDYYEKSTALGGFGWSRDQIRPGFFTAEERAVYPPVTHPVVRANPVNGQRSLFLGAHASHLVGLPVEEGRALLRELLEHVTLPRFRYRHEWTEGDLVIWDNRCVLHRATPYDSVRHQRLLQRTTVSGDPGAP